MQIEFVPMGHCHQVMPSPVGEGLDEGEINRGKKLFNIP